MADTPPLSLQAGLVTTANGKTYDMSKPAEKTAMLEEGAVYFLEQVSAVIREADPGALVTVGVFPPDEPVDWYPGDLNRVVMPLPVLALAPVDFIDIHPYPGYKPLSDLMGNLAISGVPAAMPVIIGEFGGFKFAYESPQRAAYGLQEWQVESCKFDVGGWLHWHWRGVDDHEVWTGTEGEGAINESLSPLSRSDPCAAGQFDFFENNLAYRQKVTVSNTMPSQPPDLAVDGWINTSWNANDTPPQWIEIQFAEAVAIRTIRLVVAMYPDGPAHHRVSVLASPEVLEKLYPMYPDGPAHHRVSARLMDGSLVLLAEFEQEMYSGQFLQYVLPSQLENVQSLRIDTLSSPSFVAWHEIQVFDVPLGDLPSNLQTVPVTFVVSVPDNTDGTIYLAGDFGTIHLPQWIPDGLSLEPDADGTWRITLRLPVGAEIKYAFTRGSWESVERNADCSESEPRVLLVESEVTVEHQVIVWRDSQTCK